MRKEDRPIVAALSFVAFAIALNAIFAAYGSDSQAFAGFVSALLASAAGAVGGAYGAQWIVERGRAREQILQEIRRTNTAIMLAHDISNTYLSLKRQHILRLMK